MRGAGEIVLDGNANALYNGPYSGKPGWFSAGYGPFRRLTGASGEGVMDPSSRAARHATLFREAAALTHCEGWLVSLYSQSIDPALPGASEARTKYELAVNAINELLPDEVRLASVTSRTVEFQNLTSGATVRLGQLSDGYRSFLSLAIDLLRHLLNSSSVSFENGQVLGKGIVLIDEIDTHLHPRWQREIGPNLCRVFPELQFIVTTHSPFIAQTARPGGLFVLERRDDTVAVTRPLSSVQGMRADQILTSPLFDLLSTRDIETERDLRRREALTLIPSPTDAERAELAALKKKLASLLRPPGDTFAESETYARLQMEFADDLASMEEE